MYQHNDIDLFSVIYVKGRRGCTMLESRTLLVETTVITCFSDQTVDERCLNRMILKVVNINGLGCPSII